MKNKRSVMLIGAVAAVALLTSCAGGGGTATDAEQLTVGRVKSLDGISGDTCVGGASIQTMPMLYGQILRPAEDGSGLAGAIVDEWEYDETTLTYSLTVSDEAMFSDGAAVTAEDLAFSIQQWRDGQNSGAYYSSIADQRVVDDQTVEVELAFPDTFLPDLLSWCTSTLYPADFGGKSADQYFEAPVGAGPYVLDEWQNPVPSEVLELSANPHGYLGDTGIIEHITIKTSSDVAQQLLAFRAGDLDIIEDIGSDDVAQLDPENVIASEPSYAMDLMLNAADPALADPRVRQAISLGIDRDELVSALYEGVIPAVGVIPTNIPNSVPGGEPLSYDPDRAAELLAEAGVTELSVEIGYESGQSSTSNVASLLERQLSKIGVTVVLKPIDQATSYALAGAGDFQGLMSGVAAISPSAFDPIGFLMFAWYPWTASDTTVIEEQYGIGTSTFDNTVRDEAVATVQEDAFAQSTVIGLYNQPSIFAVSDRVTGFVATPYRYWESSTVRLDG
jgi:peptide/nickel transport system substrate-binding protein